MSKFKVMYPWEHGVSFSTKNAGDFPDAKCVVLSDEHNEAINAIIGQIKDKPLSERVQQHSKYHREIKPSVWVDVYEVLGAFTADVSERAKAAVDHAIKKLLAPGQRGVKSERQDLVEARDSLNRAIQLLDDWA